MKLNDNLKQLAGRLHIEVINRDGETVETHDWNNLITKTGYHAVGQCLAGIAGARINRIAVGTNDTAPTFDDTAITNAVTSAITNAEYSVMGVETNEWVKFHFNVGYFQAVGMNITEWGLITQDGRLFSRVTRSAIQKTNEIMLTGYWIVKI